VKVGLAIVERKEMQYLYRDGEHFTFMDMETYEQLAVDADLVGDAANYLAEGSSAQVAVHQGVPIALEMPASVALTVTQTQPAVRGDTKTNTLKPATLETGYVAQVPLFVEEGERIKVDTRSGGYIERVK
jgi:elongation factor P